MQPYLTELNRQKVREITLSEKQLRHLYGSVLKHLEAHTDFRHTEGVDLTDYEPPEAHFSIYLDNPAGEYHQLYSLCSLWRRNIFLPRLSPVKMVSVMPLWRTES